MLLNSEQQRPSYRLPVWLGACSGHSNPAKKEKPRVQVLGLQFLFLRFLTSPLTHQWPPFYSHQRKARAVHQLTWLQTNPRGKVYGVHP
jgi:hypothetical protein